MVRREVRKRGMHDLVTRLEWQRKAAVRNLGNPPLADRAVPSSAISCFWALSRARHRLKVIILVSRCSLELFDEADVRVFVTDCEGAGVEAVVLLPGCFLFLEGAGAGACVEKVDMPGSESLAGTPFGVDAVVPLTAAKPFSAGATFSSSCATAAFFDFVF